MLLQKAIVHPYDHFACGIRELHATPIMSAIPLGKLNLE
jgi:hypothetical protein